MHIDLYRPAAPKGRVILFHGVGGNGRLLSFLALPLCEAGFEVVCPDLPLYGCTRYTKPVSYDCWVACGVELVNHFQRRDQLPLFLFGLSAGGMLAYQIAAECREIRGVIASCLLDQREPAVTKATAASPLLGRFAKPFLAAVRPFAGNWSLPMKWLCNMKAITNNAALTRLLMQDQRSSGARVPLGFVHAMLHPVMKTEPERFKACPILLVHSGADRWTQLSLSRLFFDRLACEKKLVILEGAGHFPIEARGLSQMEQASIAFLEQQCS